MGMDETVTVDGFPRAPAERVARYRAEGLWDTRVLADGVEAAAARRPDAVALADNDAQLSYADLAKAVARAAAIPVQCLRSLDKFTNGVGHCGFRPHDASRLVLHRPDLIGGPPWQAASSAF